MKKIYALALALIMLVSSITIVHADTSVSLSVDGLTMDWDAYAKNGRTFVSADELSAVLGTKLTFSDNKVVFESFEDTVEMTLGVRDASVNGKSLSVDASPEVKDGMVMVPVRFVAESLGCKVDWLGESQTVAVTDAGYANEKGLLYTRPETLGQYNALKRSADLTDFTFTPVRDMPIRQSSKVETKLEAGVEYTGVPYSSCEPNDKFIGVNVSEETFLSALANPDSVLYTKDLYQFTGVRDTYYGIVCNGLVRYAYGIKERYNTRLFHTIPGMTTVANRETFKVEDIEIADALCAWGDGTNHTALISGIFRDPVTKEIKEIEISHATRPRCKRVTYTPEEFYEKWKKYSLYRYDYIDTVEYDEEVHKLMFESDLATKLPVIAVDYGNKSNYDLGEETVISVFREGASTVEIVKNDEVIETVNLDSPQKFKRTLDRGYYKVRIKETGDFAEFAVCGAEIEENTENGIITVKASPCDENSKLMFMDFRIVGQGSIECLELTEEEKNTGIVTRPVPEGTDGYNVHFENKYGVWVWNHPGIAAGCYPCAVGEKCPYHETNIYGFPVTK